MAGPTVTGTSTRERLIETAERLFADRGVGAVSLREIGATAGQRNTAAVKFHFGGKDALIVAVLDHRMKHVNDERLRLLATMQAQGRNRDLRSLLDAFVVPLARSMQDPQSYYLRFLAQLASDPLYREATWNWDSATSLNLVWSGITQCLDHLPHRVVRIRMRMLMNLVLHTLADRERRLAAADGRTRPDVLVELVDAAHGMLTAPVTT